jgi:hypothetical protein
MDGEIWHREECYQTQGAVFDVYREMGCGFFEAVYQEASLSKRSIIMHTQITAKDKQGICVEGHLQLCW